MVFEAKKMAKQCLLIVGKALLLQTTGQLIFEGFGRAAATITWWYAGGESTGDGTDGVH
jgi:hypothetical protein